MVEIGVQTMNIVDDVDPRTGFEILKQTGFSCADFSLNSYLTNTSLYRFARNSFFEKTDMELEKFFTPHKTAANAAGVCINQMHMPYPLLVPNGSRELNDFLWNEVAPQSLKVCAFFECPHIVIHGFKLAYYSGSEDEEWAETEKFLHFLAPIAQELRITMCIENLYSSQGGHIVEGPCCNAQKVIERLDRFNDVYNAEVLGFCFDTGHANLIGLDFESFIAKLGHRLKVLHIHDNDGVRDLHQIPFTFTRSRENMSSTDWGSFIRGLKAINYDGVLSFETAPVLSAFPAILQRDALMFLAKIGKYFAVAMNAFEL